MHVPTDGEKTDFINGQQDRLRFGGYGGTVNLKALKDGVLVSTTKPKRTQTKLTPNSRAIRETAVEAAELMMAAIREQPSNRTPTAPPATPRKAGILTPRDVFLAYLRQRLGTGIPEDEVFSWVLKDVIGYRRELPRNARRRSGSASYTYGILLAARRLHADGVVPLDGDIEMIQPAELDDWVNEQLEAGLSPHTVKTYRNRFQSAVRMYIAKRPNEWGDRRDPTVGVEKISTEHIEPPEVTPDQVEELLAAARRLGCWRVVATILAADATARRVGSISGGRDDLHEDAPPLCAADFSPGDDGVLEVTWRAIVQKGKSYGRGDVVQRATRQLCVMYRWLSRFHPNPLGPEHPLIWSEEDASQPASYDALLAGLDATWMEAFGEDRPKGLGWHAFCRGTITNVAEASGTLAAADFSGRSVKVVEQTYRRVRRGSVDRTARRLDEMHRQRRRDARQQSTENRGQAHE